MQIMNKDLERLLELYGNLERCKERGIATSEHEVPILIRELNEKLENWDKFGDIWKKELHQFYTITIPEQEQQIIKLKEVINELTDNLNFTSTKKEEYKTEIQSLKSQLEEKIKFISKINSDYYQNLEVDNSQMLDRSARLESQNEKLQKVIDEIRESKLEIINLIDIISKKGVIHGDRQSTIFKLRELEVILSKLGDGES